MTTFVLCHGAWGGGFVWREVADRLRAQGHTVFVATYTGLGERRHLASPDVNLSTHIEDVRAVIRCEDLDQFVLVGHSYGGMVVTGVADKDWEKITRLVYLDAFLPKNGQCLNELTGEERTKATFAAAEKDGEGWQVPRPPGSISPDLSDAFQEKLLTHGGPHPLATFTESVAIEGNHLKIEDKIYVLATAAKGTPFYQFADWTETQDGWKTIRLEAYHHLQMSMPNDVTRILTG